MSVDNGPTTMLDIYVASGGVRSEDGQSVTISNPGQTTPFDIVLRVIPIGVEMPETSQKERVTFAVLLHGETVVEGGLMHFVEHEAELTLPVDQVRFLERPA